MPEATATKTTTPRRTRAAAPRRTAATKAETTKPATAAKEETPNEESPKRARFELVYDSDSKNYAKFVTPGELTGVVVGQLYFPHGTDRVVVTVLGPDDVISDISQD